MALEDRADLRYRVFMETKIDKIRAAVAQDDWPTALRIAARFPRLGSAKAAIERGQGTLKMFTF